MRGNATGRSMGEYRLSQSAKNDLIAIAQYGDEHFGLAQSNRYRDQLKQRFSVLAGQPQQIIIGNAVVPYRLDGMHNNYLR